MVILCGSWTSFRKVAYPGIQLMTQNGIGDGAIMEAQEWKGERVLHKPSQTSVVSSLLCYYSAVYYRNSIPDCTQK